MYISKKDRLLIKNKFAGKCAYSGTELLPDWQVDHVDPLVRNWWLNNSAIFPNAHTLGNMVPSQRRINNYKHSMSLSQFREFMQGFHIRIAKLPKNPKTQKSIKHKANMLQIANLFGITPDEPFSGKFYFETIEQNPICEAINPGVIPF